jgi:glucose-6-phosphate 1-dehydrogenase
MPLPVELGVREEALAIVVLGANGNLATKKLMPTIYNLFAQRFLPPMTSIVGYGRKDYTTETWRDHLRGVLVNDPGSPGTKPTTRKGDETDRTIDAALKGCEWVRASQYYAGSGDDEDDDTFDNLLEVLERHEAKFPTAKAYNRIFYLALPYDVWPKVLRTLKVKCMGNTGFSRVVLEKPFGTDLGSALKLNANLSQMGYAENQLYRIDRYLGKEIMENLLVMRFANRFLSPLWNRDNIKDVQIIFKEPFGAEDQGRITYFDQQGIIRDVIQNHLLQALALVAMEKPASLSEDDIRNEKLKVLKCVQTVEPQNVCVGQYTYGKGHRGYIDHPSVPDDSVTPTFAMLVMNIRNERWDGVPFILKAGKGLNEKRSVRN